MALLMTPRIMRKAVKIACIQFASGPQKSINLEVARTHVLAAAANGAGIVVLPECFNSPYSTAAFPEYAEVLHPSPPPRDASPTFYALASMAQEAGVYLIGGSIPELESHTQKIFNTCLVFSPSGVLLGFHRKAHLFNVDFPTMSFRESDVLSPGDAVTIIDLEDVGKIGLGICFDVRFPEPAHIAARLGAFCLIYPSAFNSTTGPLHWDLLSRARALDNQVFVAMCSQSFSPESDYPAWGHSMVVDPSGKLMASAARDETIVYADLNDNMIHESRRQVPLETSRRFDIYPDVSIKAAGAESYLKRL
ncbi:carbon-nitrogen hydrolase [Dactylonectria macrodidyma]|uniref:Carbon-nitrogen hydrolase n=1 Tax=Dactylonectria macrodidyma TaxID=307937 RepID=A0A9P9JD08_9HYPO|nr:carbon-nitrogen hydrolase [Dactylonectria macrodidyma]